MHNFEFVKPSSVADAVKALATEGAQALSGGQTLTPTMKQRLAAPSVLVSLTGIAEMKGVKQTGSVLWVGGATPHAVVAREAGAFPALVALAGGIGDPAVRNRGTIGGSIANNDPAACYPAGVLGSGATVITNKRRIAADDYFTGMFSTALAEGEIVTAVEFPIPKRAAYAKFDQPASRFALTGVFVAQAADGSVRVAVTGASNNGVFRWKAAEAALKGNFSGAALAGLTVDATDMIADLHGSAAYRANLVKVMAQRAVSAA
jgi:carbon-monoxide dehydrogenase medium subunit